MSAILVPPASLGPPSSLGVPFPYFRILAAMLLRAAREGFIDLGGINGICSGNGQWIISRESVLAYQQRQRAVGKVLLTS
jgi:hypothetical protein